MIPAAQLPRRLRSAPVCLWVRWPLHLCERLLRLCLLHSHLPFCSAHTHCILIRGVQNHAHGDPENTSALPSHGSLHFTSYPSATELPFLCVCWHFHACGVCLCPAHGLVCLPQPRGPPAAVAPRSVKLVSRSTPGLSAACTHINFPRCDATICVHQHVCM